MQALLHIYRRLDEVQRKRWFCIIASIVVVAACAGFFGTLLLKSYSLSSQRQALIQAMSDQNLQRGDEHAVSLKATGEIHLNGRTYGGPHLLKGQLQLFDEAGNITNILPLSSALIHDQRPPWAPEWMLDEPGTTWMLAIVCTLWLLLIVWMHITVAFALTAVGAAIPSWISYTLDYPQWAMAFAGIGLLTFTFLLLTRAALVALNQPAQALAVAHTVIKEASRRGISLVFIILLLVVLPLLPMLLNPDAPLRFQIQSFISLSLGITFSVAAVMTLFFSCASVAFEIRDRQIWQLMTKPLARLNYLLGKWLGIMTINLVILAVAGVSIFTYVRYLSNQPVERSEAGFYDLLAVRDEVLTARLGGKPVYEKLSPEEVNARLAVMIENDPDLSAMERVPLRTRAMLERRLQDSFSTGQRTVPPNGAREYVFTGLSNAKKLATTVTFRYRFHILRDNDHETFQAGFIFNDDPATARKATYVPAVSHSVPVSTALIDESGKLKITVVNLNPPAEGGIGALNFEEADFELLYKVGTFEGNFIRALMTVWLKLAFLAALGTSCATFLSFPVACLFSFTVFIAGMLGPYLAEALEWYYPPEADKIDWTNIGLVLQWAFESCTRYVALAIVFLLSSFGEYRPAQSLVEGRLIQWSALWAGALKLGLLWSGLAMIVGYSVLRRRQLAIYSGQG